MTRRDEVTRQFDPLQSVTQVAAGQPPKIDAPPPEEITLRAAAVQTRLDDLLPSLRQPILTEFILNEIQIRRTWGLSTSLADLLSFFPTQRELLETAWNSLPHLATVEGTHAEGLEVSSAGSPSPLREIPRQIGDYLVENCVGEGSFGIVYRAVHTTTEETVAIKLLKTWQASDATREQRLRNQFAAEAQAMSRFDHPHIVRVLEIDEQASPPYFVQQFVDGQSLADRLIAGKPELIETLEYCHQIADALSHIHAQEKWHRDLKPANILLDANDHIYLTDFGLVLDDSQRWEVERVVAGTFQYMAPEQIQASTHLLNAKCDLWSLGVILYEMLTGKRPFKGETTERLRDEILYRTPASPRELDQSIPRSVNHLCMQCLSKSDADRPHSAADVRDDFAHMIQELKQPHAPVRRTGLTPLPFPLPSADGSSEVTTSSSFGSTIEPPIEFSHWQPSRIRLHSQLAWSVMACEETQPELEKVILSRLSPQPVPSPPILIMTGGETPARNLLSRLSRKLESVDAVHPLVYTGSSSVIAEELRDYLAGFGNSLDTSQTNALVRASQIYANQISKTALNKLVLFFTDLRFTEEDQFSLSGRDFLDFLQLSNGRNTQVVLHFPTSAQEDFARCLGHLLPHVEPADNSDLEPWCEPREAVKLFRQIGLHLQQLGHELDKEQREFLEAGCVRIADGEGRVHIWRLLLLVGELTDRLWNLNTLRSLLGPGFPLTGWLSKAFAGDRIEIANRRVLLSVIDALPVLANTAGLTCGESLACQRIRDVCSMAEPRYDDLFNAVSSVPTLIALGNPDPTAADRPTSVASRVGPPQHHATTLTAFRQPLLAWSNRIKRLCLAIGEETRIEQIEQAEALLRSDRFRIGLLGKAVRGKSTLANLLIGRNDDTLAPIDRLPCTRKITRFRNAQPSRICIVAPDATGRDIALDEVRPLVTEPPTFQPQSPLAEVSVAGYFPRLPSDIELIDTPAYGSLSSDQDRYIVSMLPQLDAAIVVLSCRNLIDPDELELLNHLQQARIRHIFLAFNRVDDCTAEEVNALINLTMRQLNHHQLNVTAAYKTCAKRGLDGDWQRSGCRKLVRRIEKVSRHYAASVLGGRFVRRLRQAFPEWAQSLPVGIPSSPPIPPSPVPPAASTQSTLSSGSFSLPPVSLFRPETSLVPRLLTYVPHPVTVDQ